MSMETDMGSLKLLIDEELSSVCFVRDYVEFHFDGPILRALSRPDLKDAVEMTGGPWWRDRLCSLIGQKVYSVSINKDVLSLYFSNDSILEMSVLPQPPSYEAIHFVPTGLGSIEIW